METPNDAPTGQDAPLSSGDAAASVFSDITNPAVEAAVEAAPGSGSTNEPVALPTVADFKLPTHEEPTKVDLPVAPVAAPAGPAVVIPPTTPGAQPLPAIVVPQPQPAAVVPAGVDPEQFAQFQRWQAQNGGANFQQQPQVVAQPVAPTQEQIDKALNRHKLSVAEFNSIFDEKDPAKAAEIFDGIMEKKVIQAVTMSSHLIQDAVARVESTVRPYMSFADNQREHMLREQFLSANPDLRGQDVVIDQVMKQMVAAQKAGSYRPVSTEQVFQDVAQSTKALIASMQQQGPTGAPQLVVGQPQQVPQPQYVAVPQKPTMAALPSGNGGGGLPSAAPNAAAPGESQAARSVFS